MWQWDAEYIVTQLLAAYFLCAVLSLPEVMLRLCGGCQSVGMEEAKWCSAGNTVLHYLTVTYPVSFPEYVACLLRSAGTVSPLSWLSAVPLMDGWPWWSQWSVTNLMILWSRRSKQLHYPSFLLKMRRKTCMLSQLSRYETTWTFLELLVCTLPSQ